MGMHLDGPFEAALDDEANQCLISDEHGPVGSFGPVPGMSDEALLANGRLWASAPELLAALRDVIGLAEEAVEARRASDDPEDREMLDVYEGRIERAWGAIAGTTGQ